MKIPFVDLKSQYLALKNEIDSAVHGVLDAGDFIQGRACQEFESIFARFLGAAHCVAVANGTDAIYIGLRSMGIGAGDGVITAANSFIASSEAVTQTGARVDFVDCDPKTRLMDLDALEAKLAHPGTQKYKALIPVHLYGRALDMDRLMSIAKRFDLKVLEDCAQAHGARWNGRCVGTFGNLSTFSFYPGKNLGAYGDGGALVTNDPELAKKVRMCANHGRIAKYDHEFEGVNSRLDTLQAAVLNQKLPHLAAWNAKRYANAKLYQKHLSKFLSIVLPEIPAEGGHVFHLYVIESPRRDELLKHLNECGVSAGVHYPIALPNLKAYSYLGYKPSDFPVASRLQSEILSLPIFPELTEKQIQYVAEALEKVLT